jgi:hypothetical protein
MSSPALVTIKNHTSYDLITRVTRDNWVEQDGKTIDKKTIKSGTEETYRVVAKTGHHGELDIDLLSINPGKYIGQLKIRSIKDPQIIKKGSIGSINTLSPRFHRY